MFYSATGSSMSFSKAILRQLILELLKDYLKDRHETASSRIKESFFIYKRSTNALSTVFNLWRTKIQIKFLYTICLSNFYVLNN